MEIARNSHGFDVRDFHPDYAGKYTIDASLQGGEIVTLHGCSISSSTRLQEAIDIVAHSIRVKVSSSQLLRHALQYFFRSTSRLESWEM